MTNINILLYFTLLYFTLLYFTLLYFTLLYFTLLYFTLEFRRTLLPSASSGYTIVRLSFTYAVVDIGHRDPHLLVPFRNIVFPSISWPSPGSFSYWVDHECSTLGAVGAILLTCDHHLFLFAVCSAGCMFTRRLISSFLTLSILVFSAAFLRHHININIKYF